MKSGEPQTVLDRAPDMTILNKMVKYMPDHVSDVFSALADPTRRAMIAQLALGEASVSELAAPYRMSLAAASKHLSVLESAGLISKRKTGRSVRCRFTAKRMKEAMDWMARYERFWTEQLDSLDEYLRANEEGDNDNAE